LPWNQWPDGLKKRRPDRLRKETERLHDRIDRIRFIQFVFMQQWQRLRKYCHDRNIRIIGDMPMYMDHNSADVWLHPDYFHLDDDLRPMFVGGVPPDYFSAVRALGQPVFRWDSQQGSGFAWWTQRMESDLPGGLYPDRPFPGPCRVLEVPAGSRTAVEGWVLPLRGTSSARSRENPCLPVIAEDLGDTDPEVQLVMQEFGIPGMKVLLLAFQEGFVTSLNIPHNVTPHCFLYTGTHDTNTVRGWLEDEATEEQRRDLRRYFGCDLPAEALPRVFIRLAMSTVANTVIVPVQDLLGLGAEARMNRPGTLEGNWRWRLQEGLLTPEIGETLRTMTSAFARD
jgi:4-alpha-glucanotransferase